MENNPQPNNQNPNSDQNPRMVYVTRAPSPEAPEISEEVKRRHDESVKAYPELNLSEAEYMVADVRRHMIGTAPPIAGTVVLIIIVATFIGAYEPLVDQLGISDAPSVWWIALFGGGLCLLFALFSYISVWVFNMNRFYLTNESVIQRIQTGLFHHREQTINLSNIEDASYTQHGVMQSMFDYGSIRLSTEGDETTYRMTFVASPKIQIDKLTNAVEAFKNGRPIVD